MSALTGEQLSAMWTDGRSANEMHDCVSYARAVIAALRSQKTDELSDERIHEIFESYGYKRDLEGKDDFSVIRAIIAAHEDKKAGVVCD